MSVLAVIPARGGSVGLPNKHLRLLGGAPLISHTVRAALSAQRVTGTIVSTDDRRIADAARRAGAEVPFLRPPELAAADTPTVAVIQHAMAWIEEHGGPPPTYVVTLQPTSPLRRASEIDAAIECAQRTGNDSVVSVVPMGQAITTIGTVDDGIFEWLGRSEGDVRRQAARPAYRLTGGVYVTRADLLRAGRLIGEAPGAIVTDADSAIDIDVAADLQLARRSMRRRGSRPA